jgi:GNAT superfamily N-acetyltransferase
MARGRRAPAGAGRSAAPRQDARAAVAGPPPLAARGSTLPGGGIPDFTLRAGRPGDYAYAERLYRETMQPLLTALGAWDEADIIPRFRRRFKPEEVRVIGVDGADAGWLQVAETEAGVTLMQIHIEEAFRSCGIGSRLIRDLLAEARAKAKPVSLSVVRNNRALELYRRLGFRVVGGDATKFFMRRDWEGKLTRPDP